MTVHRIAPNATLCLLMAVLHGSAAAQAPPETQPPGSFSGVPWGADAAQLVAEFGAPTRVEGDELGWDDVYVLDEAAMVLAHVDTGTGLYDGAYMWLFGTEGTFSALRCSSHASSVLRQLIERYGPPSRGSESDECGKRYAAWEWTEHGISIGLITQSHPEYGDNVILHYLNGRLSRQVREAEARDRL